MTAHSSASRPTPRPIAPGQRFSRNYPCPICAGHAGRPRGKGERCHGYLSSDGRLAHCTREDSAGGLLLNAESQTYPHRIGGPCGCGATHGPASAPTSRVRPQRSRQGHAPPEREHLYCDERGRLVSRVMRQGSGRNKRIWQQAPNGAGGWRNDLGGVRRVPYRLPETLAAIGRGETIFVTEGELNADDLADLGLEATCNPGGAGHWLEEFTTLLRAAGRVRILADNDEAGRVHAEDVARSFYDADVRDLKVAQFPEAFKPDSSPGGDVTDWLAQRPGLSPDARRAALIEQIEAASVWAPIAGASHAPVSGLRVTTSTVVPNPTDLGNAERLVARHGDGLRFVHPWGAWLVWDRRRWARDRSSEVWRRAKNTVRGIYVEAAGLQGESERRELAKHAERSEGQRRMAGMIELAKSDRRIAALPESFDTASTCYLLNVNNGTLDLRAGTLGPHHPENGITKLAPVDYDPGARSDLWERFLVRALPDPDDRAFVQRYIGSALTADAGDQSLVLFYGPGANGKSTLLETIQAALGDYGHKAAFDTLLEAPVRSDRRGSPRADLLALRGARFVTAVEAGEGRRLDEQLVKELTGGDQVTARGVYHDEQTTFRPACKIVLAVNHRPEVRGSDDAIWRRVLEVPFAVTIPIAERDPKLSDRLREPEHQRAVLAWAVAGCRDWLNPPAGMDRLRSPEAVVAASRAYRIGQDELLPFIEDCCQLDPNGRVSNKELRAAYLAWASANGVRPLGPKQLPLRLQDHGCRPFKSASVRGWAGIMLSGEVTQGTFEGDRCGNP